MAVAVLSIVANSSEAALLRGAVILQFSHCPITSGVDAEKPISTGSATSHVSNITGSCRTVLIYPEAVDIIIHSLVEGNMILQLGDSADIGALQPPTLLVFRSTPLKIQTRIISRTKAKSEPYGVHVIAAVMTIMCTFAKDLFAVHIGVTAVPVVAVALLSARCSILNIKIFRARECGPSAVFWKVTCVHDGSAESSRRGVGAVCAAFFFITNTSR